MEGQRTAGETRPRRRHRRSSKYLAPPSGAARERRQRQYRVDPARRYDGLAPEIQPEQVIATAHAVRRLQRRAREYALTPEEAAEAICCCVARGRRSDTDRRLIPSLAYYLSCTRWTHAGRRVTLFFDDGTRLAVLAVPDNEDETRVVALTCFLANEALQGGSDG